MYERAPLYNTQYCASSVTYRVCASRYLKVYITLNRSSPSCSLHLLVASECWVTTLKLRVRPDAVHDDESFIHCQHTSAVYVYLYLSLGVWRECIRKR